MRPMDREDIRSETTWLDRSAQQDRLYLAGCAMMASAAILAAIVGVGLTLVQAI